MKEKIRKAYTDYFEEKNTSPRSVADLMEFLGEEKEKFYEYYKNLNEIRKEIWGELFETVKEKVKAEKDYDRYSAREKMLAFYFLLVEELKTIRAFVKHDFRISKEKPFESYFLKDLKTFRKGFMQFTDELLSEAIEKQEIKQRMFFEKRYRNILWKLTTGIIKFWVEDKSESYERSDAMIEKSVNFVFDALAPNFIDSAFDLAKFLFERIRSCAR